MAEKAETIFLGVKPGVVLPVIAELAGAIENQLVISLAAGIRSRKHGGEGSTRDSCAR